MRGQEVQPPPAHGRFGRMFPCLKPCSASEDANRELVTMMHDRDPGEHDGVQTQNFRVPAGFTYLGQFVDHDITFDPTSALERVGDPLALVDFRTPRFDLDSLYGAGPEDQPYLYDWNTYEVEGVKLLVDHIAADAERCTPAYCDLPRNEPGRALIGDPRNDEHLIIAQLHLLFIQFHNVVVESLRGRVPDEELFDTARRKVRWHYQWIVTHEFLRKLVGRTMATSVLENVAPGSAPAVRRRFYRWQRRPFIPFEFSVGAYRCGHSMVRPAYLMNGAQLTQTPILGGPGGQSEVPAEPPRDIGTLTGQRRLPADRIIEWDLFFAVADATGQPTRDPQLSLSLDTSITDPLFHLPHTGNSLPWLNLQRAIKVGLPSGQSVARAMDAPVLEEPQLLLDDELSAGAHAELSRSTPLWYYVLCEAAAYGRALPGPPGHRIVPGTLLGPVGGRIVAEVLVGLLEGDPASYLSVCPTWTPDLGPTPDDFTMSDLVRIAERRIEPRTAPG